MQPHIRYFLYARRSSDSEDKQILSIESQLTVLRAIAMVQKIEIAQEFTESASARDPGRPVFGELMKLLKAGKVQGILVWKLDRLARNMVDGGEIIYELTLGRLKEIITPEATYTNAGDSKFMLAMLFGAAEKYSDDLSSAVRRGNKTVLERGKVPGPVPLGYVKTHEHEAIRGTGTVIPDPERFETVKRIWKEVLGGNTNVSDIWRKARYEWGLTTRPTKSGLAHPIAISNLYAILRNPFYAGKVSRGGETYKGEHPPMITFGQFEEIQKQLGHREESPTSHGEQYLYHGLLNCGDCGRMLCGERHEKPGHVWIYYRCSRRRAGYIHCKAQAVREDELSGQLAALFENVIVDPTVRDWAYEAIAWWAGDDEASPEKLARRAKGALARAEQELANLTDMVIRDVFTVEEYKVRRVNQLAKIQHLREALADPVEKLAAWKTVREDMKEHGLRLGRQFRDGDDVAKRKIVTRTCSEIAIVERKPRLGLRAPFVLRSEHLPCRNREDLQP